MIRAKKDVSVVLNRQESWHVIIKLFLSPFTFIPGDLTFHWMKMKSGHHFPPVVYTKKNLSISNEYAHYYQLVIISLNFV